MNALRYCTGDRSFQSKETSLPMTVTHVSEWNCHAVTDLDEWICYPCV
jgi:hypothetical protein